MPRTVLIIDPQPFFGEALATALAEDPRIGVVGWASDEDEATRRVASDRPDVILLGVDGGSAEMTRWLRRIDGRARVIVLTRGPVGDTLLHAAALGASGVLGHDIGIEGLLELLVDTDDGRFVVDPQRLGDSLRRAAQAPPHGGVGPDGLDRLTNRERQVLDLLAEGLDDVAIGGRLRLSSHTVRTHIGNILRKLEVHSRAQAARLALTTHDPGPLGVLHIRGPDLSRP